MNVTFLCPYCEQIVHLDRAQEQRSRPWCPHCQTKIRLYGDGANEELDRCAVCGSEELFVRKNFPQRVGVAIVAVGLSGFLILNYFHQMIAAFAMLFATALLDAVIFLFVGNMLECYRCHAQHRDVSGQEKHGAFNLEIHERHRQQRLRMRQAQPTTGAGYPPGASADS